MRSDSQGPVVRLFTEEQIDFEPRPATGVSEADDVAGASLLGGEVAAMGSDGVLSIEELASRFTSHEDDLAVAGPRPRRTEPRRGGTEAGRIPRQ